jgi:hypothetical protein
VTSADARTLAIAVAITLAPLALVVVVALLRGYAIEVHLRRRP